ncbi:rhodanese-like domain-containing protein [Oxyplasma meridianum]|uniref:Rhodanese-like domain-containing protein n=1 Tax=Oxyplasma meridianum TaxID=3073602 RepID=A0AAX4NGZ9_9ARCH
MHSFNEKKVEEKEPVEVYSSMEEHPGSLKIIDVREPYEYYGDMGHVKGSHLIPLNELPDHLEGLRSLKVPIGIICNSGERSYYACSFLMQNGLKDVFNIRGGIIRWHLSGLEVEYD